MNKFNVVLENGQQIPIEFDNKKYNLVYLKDAGQKKENHYLVSWDTFLPARENDELELVDLVMEGQTLKEYHFKDGDHKKVKREALESAKTTL